ncbi:MAG TPA: hypothetical protein VMW08_18690 [Acidimicrobiales bacterium]|nr:hypothetical protein [Acidimicrobiales bacterium]
MTEAPPGFVEPGFASRLVARFVEAVALRIRVIDGQDGGIVSIAQSGVGRRPLAGACHRQSALRRAR